MTRPDLGGLDYPDRYRAMAEAGMTLAVYVPVEGVTLPLAARSGIVGEPVSDEHALVHFEGWVYGAFQYEHLDVRGKWEAAVQTAAGRAFVQYPTVARRMVRLAELLEVGRIAARDDRLTITDEVSVQRWLA